MFNIIFCSLQCLGPNGPSGPEGPAGEQGSGTSDTWHDITPARNWRQCTWDRINNGADSGAIVVRLYFKSDQSTGFMTE